jgi:hypothetical protein
VYIGLSKVFPSERRELKPEIPALQSPVLRNLWPDHEGTEAEPRRRGEAAVRNRRNAVSSDEHPERLPKLPTASPGMPQGERVLGRAPPVTTIRAPEERGFVGGGGDLPLRKSRLAQNGAVCTFSATAAVIFTCSGRHNRRRRERDLLRVIKRSRNCHRLYASSSR